MARTVGSQAGVFFALSAPRCVEGLLEQAGLAPVTSGAMDCPVEFPDQATAVRGHMSSGQVAGAIRRAGFETVSPAIAESLASFVRAMAVTANVTGSGR